MFTVQSWKNLDGSQCTEYVCISVLEGEALSHRIYNLFPNTQIVSLKIAFFKLSSKDYYSC